jgi:nucleoid-associated protein YgaU
MRTKTISRLRRAALAAAAAAMLAGPARADELEGPSRLVTPTPPPAPAQAADASPAAAPAAASSELEGPSRLEGPTRIQAPAAPEGPATAEAPAKAPAKSKRRRKAQASKVGAPGAVPGPANAAEPPQPQEPVARGETQPQRVMQLEPPLTSEGPEGKLAMPKSAEEKGMQIQPGTPEVYVIVKGDTLWDLSQKFLNNPWYWPKIWSLNAYIENPHWIYPGNKLKIIPGGPQAPAQVEPEPTNDERPQSEIANQVDTSPPEAADLAVVRKGSREFDQAGNSVSVSGKLGFKPPPVLTVRDSGLVTPDEMRHAGSLAASFEEKDMLSTYDTAYVRFPRGVEVNIGDKIILFRPEGDIVQPFTGRMLGTQTRSMGEAKVISLDGQLATVLITRTFEEIERGDLARPWTDQNLRVAPKANTREMQGVIVTAVRRGITTYGEANEVFVDRGERDGVEVGNTFTVIRKGDGLRDVAVYGTAYNMGATGARAAGVNVPYEDVGLLLVVDVKDRLSTAVVVRSVKELQAGDLVEMRPQGSGGP